MYTRLFYVSLSTAIVFILLRVHGSDMYDLTARRTVRGPIFDVDTCIKSACKAADGFIVCDI